MIASRLAAVRERLDRAAARAGRRPEDVTLVAVSKTFPVEAVREAFTAGVRHFGENRVQEAEGKIEAAADLGSAGLAWHLVGHLQSNKAKRALALFDLIHSVDGPDLARRLDRMAADAGRSVRALLQVDLAREPTKFGLPEPLVLGALESIRALTSLRIEGLMAMPPYEEDPERARPLFRRLRELRDSAAAAGLLRGTDLSMGMSHDFEIAVEEGATMVRLGTAVFGERPPARSGTP